MKMYEKLGMSTEAALKWVIDGVENRPCTTCPAFPTKGRDYPTCALCAARFLFSEVPEPPKVPRWQTAKTQEDFDKLFDGFEKVRKGTCEDCKYYEICNPTEDNIKDCYHAYLHAYLTELVDAPESEDDNGEA